MKIKQSLCCPIFQNANTPLEALFEEASRANYAAVELWGRGSNFAEFVALACKYKLAIASMCRTWVVGRRPKVQ